MGGRVVVLFALFVVACLLGSGCGGGEESALPTPTDSAHATATPLPVLIGDIMRFLPEAPLGWQIEAGPTDYLQELEGHTYSEAVAQYGNSSTGETVTVHIRDSAGYHGFYWWPEQQLWGDVQTSEVYAKKISIDGYHAYKKVVTVASEPSCYLVVVVADRFLISIVSEGEGSLDQFSGLVDYGGLAALK